MPTNRRRRAARKRCNALAVLDPSREYELWTGRPLLPWQRFYDTDELRAAWLIHGARLMEEFIEARPGRRPFAWWLIEAVPNHGPRRIIDPEWNGKDTGLRFHGLLHTSVFPHIQETEWDYLKRHGLLRPGEWERCRAKREADEENQQDFLRCRAAGRANRAGNAGRGC
jgi:hypothetical protein